MERGPPGRPAFPPPGKFSAARSHVLNDQYMDDFEKAWEELHGLQVGGGGGGPGAAGGSGRGPAGAAGNGGSGTSLSGGYGYGAPAGGAGGGVSQRTSLTGGRTSLTGGRSSITDRTSPSGGGTSLSGGAGYGSGAAAAGARPVRGVSAGRRPSGSVPAGAGAGTNGGAGGGYGSPATSLGMSPSAAARAGSSLAAQQRNMYAALEDPSAAPPSFPSPLSYGYGGRPVASPSRGSRPSPLPARPSGAAFGAPPMRAGSGGSGSFGVAAPAPAPTSGPFPNASAASPVPARRSSGPGVPPPGAAARRVAGAAAAAGAAGGSRYPARVATGWNSGPVDPAGMLCDLSDRPNTCSAADWSRGEVVVGSTDHALYVLDAQRGLKKRTLYSKASGHTEWVTCVTYASEGRIVSGGMDSKLWVWPAAGNRGMQAEGHFGPISQVKYDRSSELVVSASYDKTIRLWQLGARPHEAGCLQGHEAPVLEMQLSADGRIASGDRSGHVLLWDLSSGGVSWRMKNVHQGHVTALAWFDEGAGGGGGGGAGGGGGPTSGCFVSGGQDGVVRVWDPRAKSNVAKVQLHVNEQGHGAVGDIAAGGPAAAGMVVTAGADGTARTLDPRLGFALAGTVRLTNFPYSMTVAGGIAAVGCGDGSIHFIDIASARTLYALGANRAAVRCMEASYDKLVCSGDDGKAIMYSFS